MVDKKTEVFLEIEHLKAMQDYFVGEGQTRESYSGRPLRFFPVVEDFEKKYLQEAANKISAIYKEKIFEKVEEYAAICENEESQQGKLGYSFTWLRKLKSATDDAETEKILQDWLAELAEKKSAKND